MPTFCRKNQQRYEGKERDEGEKWEGEVAARGLKEDGGGGVMFRGLVGSKSCLKDPLIGSVLPWINC